VVASGSADAGRSRFPLIPTPWEARPLLARGICFSCSFIACSNTSGDFLAVPARFDIPLQAVSRGAVSRTDFVTLLNDL